VRIPKADLHTHLDGSIRIPTLIDLAKQYNVELPSYDPVELHNAVFPETYASLTEYLRGFGYITACLRATEALERVAFEVGLDAYHSGVRYLELRFAPQLHAIPGKLSIEEVICAVNRGLERASCVADELDRLAGERLDFGGATDVKDEEISNVIEEVKARSAHPYHPDAPRHHYGIIVCAMRCFLPTFSPYYEAFWEVHKGEDPHRVFGLASVALVTAVNNLRRKGKCCCHDGRCDQCNDCLFRSSMSVHDGAADHEYILPVVAIDIAGAESGYPASDHREAFDLAHQSFLNKTVHAGEAYGPESIFEAITNLHAERIGHGLHLFRWDMIGAGEGRGGKSRSKEKDELTEDQKREYVENLTRYLCTMRICVEVCLSSNLQTMPELNGDVQNHPARKMIDEGLAVTFCTDNTLVSHTSMSKELELAVSAFELSPGQLRNMVFNGFKRSFMAKRYRTKRDYNRTVISYYKKIEREFGLGDGD
jgi:adenosine deaminase